MRRSLVILALVAGAMLPASAAPAPGVTVLAENLCSSTAPVAGPWDVYEDVFSAGAPTWLPAHTHRGIECTLAWRGTTTWWFAGAGKVPILPGRALLTAQGRVHTAGDAGPARMTYFAVHVLVAGSPFRTLVADPNAPKVVSTNAGALFQNIFRGQPAVRGPFRERLRILSLAPGASFAAAASTTTYYSVVSGRVRVTHRGAVAIYGPAAKWAAPADGSATAVAALGAVPAVLVAARAY